MKNNVEEMKDNIEKLNQLMTIDKPEPLNDPKEDDGDDDILKMKIVRAIIKSIDGIDLEKMLIGLGVNFENALRNVCDPDDGMDIIDYMIKTGRFPPTHGHISNKLKKQKKMMKKDL
jgi:hypothetical protein